MRNFAGILDVTLPILQSGLYRARRILITGNRQFCTGIEILMSL